MLIYGAFARKKWMKWNWKHLSTGTNIPIDWDVYGVLFSGRIKSCTLNILLHKKKLGSLRRGTCLILTLNIFSFFVLLFFLFLFSTTKILNLISLMIINAVIKKCDCWHNADMMMYWGKWCKRIYFCCVLIKPVNINKPRPRAIYTTIVEMT